MSLIDVAEHLAFEHDYLKQFVPEIGFQFGHLPEHSKAMENENTQEEILTKTLGSTNVCDLKEGQEQDHENSEIDKITFGDKVGCSEDGTEIHSKPDKFDIIHEKSD